MIFRGGCLASSRNRSLEVGRNSRNQFLEVGQNLAACRNHYLESVNHVENRKKMEKPTEQHPRRIRVRATLVDQAHDMHLKVRCD